MSGLPSSIERVLDVSALLRSPIQAERDPLAHRPYADWDSKALNDELAEQERSARESAARQVMVIAEIARRTRRVGEFPTRSGHGLSANEPVVAETGMALGLNAAAAGARVDESIGLMEIVPSAVAALRAGLIGWGGLRALRAETTDLDPADAAEVVARVLDRLGDGLIACDQGLGRLEPEQWWALDEESRRLVAAAATSRNLGRWARREAIRLRDQRAAAADVDPSSAAAESEQARRERGRAARCVRVTPGFDEMSWIGVYAPDAQVIPIMRHLEEQAEAARGSGTADHDPVSFDQAMADAAIQLLSGGAIPVADASVPRPIDQATAPVGPAPRPIHVTVIVDGEAIAYADRLGPLSRVSLEDLLALARRTPGGGVTVRTTKTFECRGHPPGSPQGPYEVPDPLARAIKTRDVTCRFPGCAVSADRCDNDHTIPYEDGGPTCVCNLAALCRRHHRLKTHAPGWTVRQVGSGVIEWTDPYGRTYTTRPAIRGPAP